MDLNSTALDDATPKDQASYQFFINGPVGRIEALLNRATESSRFNAIAVICHPHPLYDGSLHNKVTYTLARTLNSLGIPALRFNFRGVGESQGNYANGEGELQDLLAVIAEAKRLYPGRDLWLAGFSFGAYIALRAAHQAKPAQLITIAPAINFFDPHAIRTPTCPWLLIQGKDDDIVPCEEVLDWLEDLHPAPSLRLVEGTGHFFHRQLVTLRNAIEHHFEQNQLDSVAV
ncbi:MAG: alpha/beta hydrolase [Gammaproteobacteria bacterium]|nr:alpha/beta hydrolase [Gammaproteobacteria bacterium]